MLLEEFLTRLRTRGADEAEIDEVTFHLSQEFPGTFAHYDFKPMSAGMDSIELPDEVVARYFDAEENPRKAKGRHKSVYVEMTDSEKDVLREQVVDNAGNAAEHPGFVKKLEERLSEPGRVRITVPADNAKLGDIQNFSLPVGQPVRGGSCVGASEECESVCYLTGGFEIDEETGKERASTLGYLRSQAGYHVGMAVVQLFPERWLSAMEDAIVDPVFRIHVGGDFYSAEYVDLWIRLAERKPDTRFFAYTRSWNDGKGNVRKEMIPVLRRFSETENCRLLLSCDTDTGVPPVDLVPHAIRAWMAVGDSQPPAPPELVFRDKAHLNKRLLSYRASERALLAGKGDAERIKKRLANLRTEMQRHVRGFFVVKGRRVPVCPIEVNPMYIKKSGELSCETCGWCFSMLFASHGARDEDRQETIAKFTGKDVGKTIRSLGRFARTAANPPTCLTCYGDCVCGLCKCGPCDYHDGTICICCCGCVADESCDCPAGCMCPTRCEQEEVCECGTCLCCDPCEDEED